MVVRGLLRAGISAAVIDDRIASVWASTVYQVAREINADVVASPEPPTVGRNYYRVELRWADGLRIRVLLNAAARLVGAVAVADDELPGSLVARFVDVPRPDLFGLAELLTAAAEELEAPLTYDRIANLLPSERRDIAYHTPARVGDVIFNWFD